jgi:hypothetical protein
VDDALTQTYSSGVYAIDPQSPNPSWRQFASSKVDSGDVSWVAGWPLAATQQGSILWAVAERGQWVYLSPLP